MASNLASFSVRSLGANALIGCYGLMENIQLVTHDHCPREMQQIEANIEPENIS
jgi:hypothetical protein